MQRDALQKQKMKIYADQRENAPERNITPGEILLMKQPEQNKLCTLCNPNPFVVEETKGSMITVRNGSETVTRDSSNFKVAPKHFVQDSGEKDNCIETPPTVDKTEVELPNSDEPRKNTPLRRSQRQIKPSVRFSDYEHEISISSTVE